MKQTECIGIDNCMKISNDAVKEAIEKNNELHALKLASYKAELRGEINKWRMEALSAPPSEFWKGKFVAFNQVKALLEDNPTEIGILLPSLEEIQPFLYWVFHKADRIWVEHTLGWSKNPIKEMFEAYKRNK